MPKQPYGILIIHGFASSLDSVRRLEPPLQALGLPTRMPVLRGHNTASPEALRGVNWREWLADADAALHALLCEVDHAIVFGHSMGGLLALNLAAEHPDRVDSIVLAAAAVRMTSPLAPGQALHFLAPVIGQLLKKWDLPPEYADPALARFDTNYHWAPMDAIVSFLELSEVTARRLPEVCVPALILQGRKDHTVAAKSVELIERRSATPLNQKRVVWYEVTDHEMLQDCERDAVIEEIVTYVKGRVKI
jgi:carboxylesterase